MQSGTMIKRSHLAAGLGSSLLAGLAAAPLAAASPQLAVTMPSAMPLAAVGISEAACMPQLVPQLAAGSHPLAASFTGARMAKSAAILGGQMSALERMRLEQAGQVIPAALAKAASPVAVAPALTAGQARACELLGARTPSNAADTLTASYAVTSTITANGGRWPTIRSAGRFLGTERIRIGRTRFDASWERVATQQLSASDVASTLGDVPSDRANLMMAVNRWVNNEITYRLDNAQFGRRDYWADARSTLRSRMGDCEDYAILKMQLLGAAGVAREDMMLTLARDTLRRADHAVLLVRHEGEWFMLDMASDRVAPASADYGYRPVMSFAAGERFIHGTTLGGPPGPRTMRVAYAN